MYSYIIITALCAWAEHTHTQTQKEEIIIARERNFMYNILIKIKRIISRRIYINMWMYAASGCLFMNLQNKINK